MNKLERDVYLARIALHLQGTLLSTQRPIEAATRWHQSCCFRARERLKAKSNNASGRVFSYPNEKNPCEHGSLGAKFAGILNKVPPRGLE